MDIGATYTDIAKFWTSVLEKEVVLALGLFRGKEAVLLT